MNKQFGDARTVVGGKSGSDIQLPRHGRDSEKSLKAAIIGKGKRL
jgi:hypothetical protein